MHAAGAYVAGLIVSGGGEVNVVDMSVFEYSGVAIVVVVDVLVPSDG